MSYKDRTFCASPNCKNECGRKMTDEEKAANFDNQWISYGYFCEPPKDDPCLIGYSEYYATNINEMEIIG
jgi:hypothetical protein